MENGNYKYIHKIVFYALFKNTDRKIIIWMMSQCRDNSGKRKFDWGKMFSDVFLRKLVDEKFVECFSFVSGFDQA